VCERELAGVERRIQESETADRDLLKQLSDLHALDPAPPDLEALSAGIMAKRARLPDERAELVRARMGSSDAVRTAKENLNTVESELAALEKNMARTRSEFETRDKKLAESIRTQQQAAHDARTRHQTVEERKNPAYLSIGRHLSEKGVAPPNAPLHAGKLSFAHLRGALRLVPLLKERLFLRFEFRNCVRLLPRDLLAFFFNSFYSFVNPRDPHRDFFLLLFQFL